MSVEFILGVLSVLGEFGCVWDVFCGDVGILDDLSMFWVCLDEFCGCFGVLRVF